MPFDRPTLGALIADGEAAFAARIPGADLALRRSNLRVTARVQAGLLHQQYGYLDWQFRQLIPDTAEGEFLDRWARIYGIERKAATQAVGAVTFTGTNGATIAAGTRLTRPDGTQFQTASLGTIAGGLVLVNVSAVLGGAAGNLLASTQLALVTAIPGVIGTATVAATGITGGAELEADDDLRARLLTRIRNPPQGGAASDYVQWALAVPGVTRAWAYSSYRGPGTADLTFVMDGRANPIPLTADVAAVQAYIDARRPVTADSLVFAPTGVLVPVTITGLSPNTAAVRAAVQANLATVFARDAAPNSTLYRSRLWEAVASASGEDYHVLTAPATDVAYTASQMPRLGTVTYA